jgi:hypothetical protein
MLPEDKYFKNLTEAELWQRYCGFLDLSVDEFMDIQKELLMDEIERVADSTLGKKIMGDKKPESAEEFRQIVPLTTYEDYEPYLSERREDVLAMRPQYWCHSAGRGGSFKWIPHSAEFLEVVTKRCLSGMILASAKREGQINLLPGFRCLLLLAPAPYSSGYIFKSFAELFSFKPMPDPDKTAEMELQDRIKVGFAEALKSGVDVIGAIASVMVRMGEELSGQARAMRFSPSMLHPKVMLRLIRAWVRSKSEKRPILPKDLWPSKAILTGGVDTAIYKDDIAYYWGRNSYEFYVCAEIFFVGLQGWNKKWLTFVPDTAFYEFIPYDEELSEQEGSDYQPSTVLLDELEEGKLYEVVITEFYGMPLLRYRLKDVVKVVALGDKETGVTLPQVVFQRRVGETINLGGLAHLDEKVIWQAIANTGLKYADWTACKEYSRNKSFLRLYIEMKEEKEADEIAVMVDEQLKVVDSDYKDVDAYLKFQPVRVTILSPGTFQSYIDEKRREGADLAHLKPSHVNPPEKVVKRLLEFSDANRGV